MRRFLRTNLKGVDDQHGGLGRGARNLPRTYTCLDEQKLRSEGHGRAGAEIVDTVFTPPASADPTQYNLLKFFSFDSAMAATILNSDALHRAAVDFQFKVS